MSVSCDIRLDSQITYPGQILCGNILVAALTDETCLIDQIIIEVYGLAECEWTFDKHLIKPLRIYKKGTIFTGKRQFFFSRHTLANNIQLSKNPQTYTFKTNLPKSLPSTWTGRHGLIRYFAKLLIKVSGNPLQTFLQDIIVGSQRNLKLEQYLLCEARQDIRRNFRYAVINLGNVDLSIWMPFCGIAAGQSLPLLCTINNKSSVQFGGLIFILTKLEVYRSTEPTVAVKTYRQDICRIPRMVDILRDKYEYYCVLETNPDTCPTNQCLQCKPCHVTYEVWVSLQGAIPRYNGYGYPNIDTPGIPVIIGTEPLCEWNSIELTNAVMAAVFMARPPVIMEPLPPDDDIEELLNNADEELDVETELNLTRQLVDDRIFQINNKEDTVRGSIKTDAMESIKNL